MCLWVSRNSFVPSEGSQKEQSSAPGLLFRVRIEPHELPALFPFL